MKCQNKWNKKNKDKDKELLWNVYNRQDTRYLSSLHEKNDFDEVSKNLATYRSENNFVWTKIGSK